MSFSPFSVSFNEKFNQKVQTVKNSKNEKFNVIKLKVEVENISYPDTWGTRRLLPPFYFMVCYV